MIVDEAKSAIGRLMRRTGLGTTQRVYLGRSPFEHGLHKFVLRKERGQECDMARSRGLLVTRRLPLLIHARLSRPSHELCSPRPADYPRELLKECPLLLPVQSPRQCWALPPKTELWIRAAYARILRRMGQQKRSYQVRRIAIPVDTYSIGVYPECTSSTSPPEKYDAFLQDFQKSLSSPSD